MTRIGLVIVRSKMCDNGKLCGFVDVVEPGQSPSPCRPLPSLLASCFLPFPHLPLFSNRLYPYLVSFPSAKVICVGHAVGFLSTSHRCFDVLVILCLRRQLCGLPFSTCPSIRACVRACSQRRFPTDLPSTSGYFLENNALYDHEMFDA